jgi:hypothetical protein
MIDYILLFFFVLADALWFGIKFAVITIGSMVLLFAMFVAILVWLEKRK